MNLPEQSTFGQDFLDVYLEKGFGVMNKTEIETLLFHLLQKNGLVDGNSVLNSIKLKITKSKAQKLISDAEVKYGNNNEGKLKENINNIVKSAIDPEKIKIDRERVDLIIPSKLTREFVKAILQENNILTGYVTIADHVLVDAKALTCIYLYCVSEDNKQGLKEEISNMVNEGRSLEDKIEIFIKNVLVNSTYRKLSLLLKYIQ